MKANFHHPLLNTKQLIYKINSLASLRIPFLFVIDYKAENGYVFTNDELDAENVRFQFQNINFGNQVDVDDSPFINCIEPLQWQLEPILFELYAKKFDFVFDQIHKGNSFLTNLTQPTPLKTNHALIDLYRNSTAKYKLWLRDKFVVLSPETFIRINGNVISSYPMKGTIDASLPNAEESILNDPKEMAEHATIVDLIRNDLSLVATNVQVEQYRYVEKLTTNTKDLLQVSSNITGILPDNFNERLGDVLFALLPAGSICGAPKQKTLDIIEQAEGYERGFYTGICGYYDGENLDSAVMIRFIEQNDDKLIFKSGGGITSKSDLVKEYEELIQKVYVPIS